METSQIENRETKEHWNLNSPLFIKGTEFVVKNFSTKETLGLVTGEFYQEFKEEIIPILQKLFQKIEGLGCFPQDICSHHFYSTLY